MSRFLKKTKKFIMSKKGDALFLSLIGILWYIHLWATTARTECSAGYFGCPVPINIQYVVGWSLVAVIGFYLGTRFFKIKKLLKN